MARKPKREKRHIFSDKRFYADCTECGMRYENEKYESTVKRCCCGALLTWNDAKELRTVEGAK